uniref:C-type lectin domain-containing protein n=1 Tax=Magallana gigas TaxID=29159 RepID=A0A8W8P008_MAGGI
MDSPLCLFLVIFALAEPTSGNNHGVWLGYSDIQKEGQFVTLSGAKVLQYSNWSKGEPNNVNGIEHCTGYFVNTKSWNDCICAGQLHYVCKK